MNGEYYHTSESVEEYIKLAKDLSGIQLIEQLKMVLPPHSSLLEIGSGPGKDWNILNQSFNTTGSDYSNEFLKHLMSTNPNDHFLELDASKLTTDQKFDGIYSNKVLHHLKELELTNSVKRQSKILNEDGIICHSFWKGQGTEIFKGLFVNYHSESSLRGFFGKYFEILSIESYEEFEKDDSLLLIGKKK